MASMTDLTADPCGDLSELSVLHVEDDGIIQFHMHSILDGKVGELRSAADGEEGLELFRSARPDVVVSDIRMPRMDGLTMVGRIRETDPDVPVIFTSAYSDAEYLLKAIEFSVDRYIVKPFNHAQVLRTLSKVAVCATRQRQIEEADRFNRFLLDMNSNYIVTLQGDRIEYLNRPFLDYLGCQSVEDMWASGRTIGDLLESVDGHHDSTRLRGWLDTVTGMADESLVLRFKGNGTEPGRAFVARSKRFPDSERHVVTLTDITRIEEERSNLAELAYTDHLTGVGNRYAFHVCMEREMERAKRYGQVFSLIMMDIDDFKEVNDTFGHDEGDRVLKGLADLVRRNIRLCDEFARWGGEEFMLLAPGCDLGQAGKMAEKIGALIRSEALGPKRITCSFGVTEYLPGESAETILRRVDDALYAAKDDGKNRIEYREIRPSSTVG